jgi:hypothetical protein
LHRATGEIKHVSDGPDPVMATGLGFADDREEAMASGEPDGPPLFKMAQFLGQKKKALHM